MTREEVINGLYDIKNWKCNGDAKMYKTIVEAIQALKQPEPCGDAVSRNAIIQKLNTMDRYVSEELILCDTDKKFPKNEVFIVDDVYEEIVENLPSAQPENIRCYECKHGIHSGCGDVYICHVSPELVMEHAGDFYCGYAERRTDGVDR